jgi:heptaprenyl diphosphate synthase
MGEWQNEQTALVKEISRTCSQPFLAKVIGAPDINPLRVSALMLAFTDQERTTPHVQMQMTAAILIQLALDTHDRIAPLTTEITQKHQLIVLAGDYFSGMYYRTLAEAGCIDYVGVLAKAVKRVNEMKTALHRKECTSLADVFQTVRVIESDIIRAVYLENEADAHLIEAVSSLLTAERLLNEKENPFIVYDVLLHMLDDSSCVMDEMEIHLHGLESSIRMHTQKLNRQTAAVVQGEYDRIFNRELRYVEEG